MITYNEFVDYLRDEEALSYEECALVMYCIEKEYGDYLSGLEAHGYEEADRSTYDFAMEQLYDEFRIDRNSDDWHSYYKCGGEWYHCFDDYDDAVEEAIESVKQFIQIEGPESIIGFEDYVDTDWFRDAMYESYEAYAQDIENEGSNIYDNRLVEECYDARLIDDEDFELDEDGEPDYTQCTVPSYELQEMLADHLCDDWGDPVEWYRENFGDDAFREVVLHHNLVDEDELAKYVVDTDGPANTLDTWDGQGAEFDFDGTTYYIYRG